MRSYGHLEGAAVSWAASLAAASRIDRTGASRLQPRCLAVRRSRSLDSADRLRMVILAMRSSFVWTENDFMQSRKEQTMVPSCSPVLRLTALRVCSPAPGSRIFGAIVEILAQWGYISASYVSIMRRTGPVRAMQQGRPPAQNRLDEVFARCFLRFDLASRPCGAFETERRKRHITS